MEILDLRPRLERRLASPAAADQNRSPLARLAGRVADRLAARRAARRQPPPADILVVSVGNLRVGGTGKTPVTMALARDLAERGIAGTILTRGYGASAPGPLVVAADDPEAGDEARLMAGWLAGRPWTVIQSRRRDAGLALALGAVPRPPVVIVEDGFQTGLIGRHLDVLILDAWTLREDALAPVTGPVLPFGPYRETAAGASRADCWLLECEEVPPGPSPGPAIAGFARHQSLRPVRPAGGTPADAAFGLVAGLARPEGFEAGCASLLPRSPVVSVRCRDHHDYDGQLVERILAAGAAHGVQAWITTGKDWVKLAGLWPSGIPIQVVDLTVTWTGRKALPDLVEERLRELGAGGSRA